MNEAVLNISKELDIIQMHRWPILVVYSPATFTEEELKNHLDALGKIYDTHREPYVLVLDARSGRRPNAIQRKIQSEFRVKYDAHITKYCRGTAFVTSSELLKGAATAMFWIKKPPTTTKFFTDFDEAVVWAEEQLQA
ncbi:MAG: STAS/SEC14 domain-containing protein [Proteobacteria bacterium]|nr:STAS/SEC14 domain-containing protein [Pseudomonadota bacterium]